MKKLIATLILIVTILSTTLLTFIVRSSVETAATNQTHAQIKNISLQISELSSQLNNSSAQIIEIFEENGQPYYILVEFADGSTYGFENVVVPAEPMITRLGD